MVESYGLYVDDEEVQTVEAGKDVVLKLKLKNNAAKDVIYKTVATLKLADAKLPDPDQRLFRCSLCPQHSGRTDHGY